MNTAIAMNMTALADTTILSADDMLKLRARADARVVDILAFATTVQELDWYLRHYTEQRREAIDEGNVSAAILAEFILAGLERALAQ